MVSRNFPFSRENALEDYTLERLKHEQTSATPDASLVAGAVSGSSPLVGSLFYLAICR
jgi:hypothetical protein